MKVERVFIKKLGYPHSNCVSESTKSKSYLYHYIKSQKAEYKQKVCMDLIRQEFIISQCNCSLYAFYSFNVTNCRTMAEALCSFSAFFEAENYFKEKLNLCPVECESVEYKISTTTSGPLSKTYLQYLRNHPNIIAKYANISEVTDEQLAASIVRLNVYYNDLGYTEISELPNSTLINLISSIGGTLGLFLGMSLLSGVELLDLIFQIICSFFFKSKIESTTNRIDVKPQHF
jgi:hypothetical protein